MAKVLVTESNLTDIGDAIRDRLQVGTQYLPSEMGDAVRSIPVIDIDTTLTRSGYAADAKVVGDRFDNLIDPGLSSFGMAADAKVTGSMIRDTQKSVSDVADAVNVSLIEDFVSGQYIQTNGGTGTTVAINSPQTSSNFAYKVVSVSVGDKITLNATGGNAGRLWAFLDSSNALITKADANAVASNLVLTVPANAAKLVLNVNLNATIGANYFGTSVDSRIAGNVDATLSVSGKAADAKVVGDKIMNRIWSVRNGSYGNASNAYYVTAGVFPYNPNFSKFRVFTDRPLDGENAFYSLGFVFLNRANGTLTYDGGAIVGQINLDELGTYRPNTDIDLQYKNAYGLCISIAEYVNGERRALRKSDFDGYNITVEYVSDSLSLAVNNSAKLWRIRNGSYGNASNANAVTAGVFPYNPNFGKFRVFTDRPLDGENAFYSLAFAFLKRANGSIAYDGDSVVLMTSYSEKLHRVGEDIDLVVGNAFGVCITIAEYIGDTLRPLRISDFDGYDISISYAYEKGIVKNNNDIINIVNAASKYGMDGNGASNTKEIFTILATTDLHGDSTRFERAIKYLNETASVNTGICLGDMAAVNFTSQYEWYIKGVLKSDKYFYTVIGNHDGGNSTDGSISATQSEIFARWIQPTLSKIGIPTLTKTYYKKEYSSYKVALIILDCYDVPDTKNGDDFVFSRALNAYSQEQIDWFISALASIPSDYHLLIAQHFMYDDLTINRDSIWTSQTSVESSEIKNYNGLIPDIVNAWINGEGITKTYYPTISGLPVISVSSSFSARGEGIFAGYICGHMHRDTLSSVSNYSNQNVINFDTTAHDLWQNHNSDLPRVNGEKSEDCITLVSVDTTSRKINLVRVGSNFTVNLVNRTYLSVPY